MKKEFEIYQDNKGNVYTITTELEELLLNDLVELYSIIKEVREYCNNNKEFTQRLEDILEILDKVDKGE